jgi:hypothetical protein
VSEDLLGNVIPTVDTLSNLFGYFKDIRTCNSKLRYFDWDGQVHLVKGKNTLTTDTLKSNYLWPFRS